MTRFTLWLNKKNILPHDCSLLSSHVCLVICTPQYTTSCKIYLLPCTCWQKKGCQQYSWHSSAAVVFEKKIKGIIWHINGMLSSFQCDQPGNHTGLKYKDVLEQTFWSDMYFVWLQLMLITGLIEACTRSYFTTDTDESKSSPGGKQHRLNVRLTD